MSANPSHNNFRTTQSIAASKVKRLAAMSDEELDVVLAIDMHHTDDADVVATIMPVVVEDKYTELARKHRIGEFDEPFLLMSMSDAPLDWDLYDPFEDAEDYHDTYEREYQDMLNCQRDDTDHANEHSDRLLDMLVPECDGPEAYLKGCEKPHHTVVGKRDARRMIRVSRKGDAQRFTYLASLVCAQTSPLPDVGMGAELTYDFDAIRAVNRFRVRGPRRRPNRHKPGHKAEHIVKRHLNRITKHRERTERLHEIWNRNTVTITDWRGREVRIPLAYQS